MLCLEKLVVGNMAMKPVKRKILLLLCENCTTIGKLIDSTWVVVSGYFIEPCGI